MDVVRSGIQTFEAYPHMVAQDILSYLPGPSCIQSYYCGDNTPSSIISKFTIDIPSRHRGLKLKSKEELKVHNW